MPLTAEQRRTRARLAANSRHHPDDAGLLEADRADGGFLDRPVETVARSAEAGTLPQRHIERVISALVAGGIKPDQAAQIRRTGFRYVPAPESDTAA